MMKWTSVALSRAREDHVTAGSSVALRWSLAKKRTVAKNHELVAEQVVAIFQLLLAVFSPSGEAWSVGPDVSCFQCKKHWKRRLALALKVRYCNECVRMMLFHLIVEYQLARSTIPPRPMRV
jgi:hypothetical protein